MERMLMKDDPTPEEADETQELLVRIQRGDPHAFDELFARHRAEIHRAVARRIEPSLRSRVDPSDVVQEAQLEAARRLRDFVDRRPMPFRLWMLRTAAERLLKFRRRAKAAAPRCRRETGRSSCHAARHADRRGERPSARRPHPRASTRPQARVRASCAGRSTG